MSHLITMSNVCSAGCYSPENTFSVLWDVEKYLSEVTQSVMIIGGINRYLDTTVIYILLSMWKCACQRWWKAA